VHAGGGKSDEQDDPNGISPGARHDLHSAAPGRCAPGGSRTTRAGRAAPPAQAGPPAQALSPDQLADLVAPVALYPDSLLSQVLVAATYPLEVVEAGQWLQQNRNLRGPQLVEAARQQNWDASVQALVVSRM